MLAVCNRVEGVPGVGVNLKYKCDAYEKLFRRYTWRYTRRYTRNAMERKLTEYLFGWLAQPCPRCGLRRRKRYVKEMEMDERHLDLHQCVG